MPTVKDQPRKPKASADRDKGRVLRLPQNQYLTLQQRDALDKLEASTGIPRGKLVAKIGAWLTVILENEPALASVLFTKHAPKDQQTLLIAILVRAIREHDRYDQIKSIVAATIERDEPTRLADILADLARPRGAG